MYRHAKIAGKMVNAKIEKTQKIKNEWVGSEKSKNKYYREIGIMIGFRD